LLDGLAKAGTGGRVLDLGCGSGILAIAAAKLGFSPVLAVDNDPVAARVAEANARRNRVTGIVTVHGGDVRRLPARPCYDVVVANILSGVLRDNAARIACAVRPDALGRLIVAGILRRQYPAVRRAFEAQGFREVRRIDEDNWSAGLFERSDYGETGRTTATVQSAQKPAAGTPRATSPRPRRRPRPRSRRAMQSHA
jgi:ribosomal protein L11 methyltransferase